MDYFKKVTVTCLEGAPEPTMSIKIDIPLSKTEISNRLKDQIYNK